MLILSTPPSLKMTLLRQKSLRSFVSCCITPRLPPHHQKKGKSPLNFEKWYIFFRFILHKCMIICYFNTAYFCSYKLIYIFITIIIFIFTSWFFNYFLKFTFSSHSLNFLGFFLYSFFNCFLCRIYLSMCAFKQADFLDKTSWCNKTMVTLTPCCTDGVAIAYQNRGSLIANGSPTLSILVGDFSAWFVFGWTAHFPEENYTI